MTNMNSELYDALIEIGVSEEKARKTAESISSTEPRFDALDRKIDALDRKIDDVEVNLDRKIDLMSADLNAKINLLGANLNAKIDRFDAKIDRVETSLRGEMAMIKWMLGILVAGVAAIILKTFSH